MKKRLVFSVFVFFMISLVLAAQGDQIQARDGSGEIHEENSAVVEVEFETTNAGDGVPGNVMARNQERKKIMIQNRDVYTELDVNQSGSGNGTKLKVKLSNGRNAEIKIMPRAASETALQRLRLKNCNESNNCTIELKETGKGNQTRATYEIQVQRHYKLLGMFQVKTQERVQVDADTGEVQTVGRAWWRFLASSDD